MASTWRSTWMLGPLPLRLVLDARVSLARPSLFDTVINPVIIELLVHFTACVRVRYKGGEK